MSCDKKPVRFLARLNECDLRSVLGRTLNSLMTIVGIDSGNPNDLTADVVKKRMRYSLVPEIEVWRVSLGHEILSARVGCLLVDGFSYEELDEILSYACTS